MSQRLAVAVRSTEGRGRPRTRPRKSKAREIGGKVKDIGDDAWQDDDESPNQEVRSWELGSKIEQRPRKFKARSRISETKPFQDYGEKTQTANFAEGCDRKVLLQAII